MVTDNNPTKLETTRQLQSIKMQSFIFDQSKPTFEKVSENSVKIETIQEKTKKQYKKENKRKTGDEDKKEQGKVSMSTASMRKEIKTKENIITETQSKYQPVYRGRMRPDPSISHHPAFATLWQYATEGCPVDCGVPWTREHI